MNSEELEPLPEAEKAEPKEGFRKRYETLLGEKIRGVHEGIPLSYINKSVRVNLLKAGSGRGQGQPGSAKVLRVRRVPWCREGFWLSGERTDLGNLREHFLGYLYVQEAASMIPPVVLNPGPETFCA